MKLLVTGSNGFLGSALVERLLVHGHRNIRCLVRPGSDRRRLDALAGEYPDGIELCTGTLNNPDDCARAVARVDRVFHLAAAIGGAPAEMFLGSVVATKNLLEAMVAPDRPRGAGGGPGGGTIQLVHCSSFALYGVSDLPRGTTVDESTPIEPHPRKRDMYSQSKQRQEEVVWAYSRAHDIPLVVLRPGVIYGPAGPRMSSRVGLNLFGIFLHLGRKNILPLTYVANCAEAFVCAADNGQYTGDVYNVVDDDLVDARQFLQRYREQVDRLRYVTVPYFATRLLSLAVEKYHAFSKGQLPEIFTRYKSDSMWKGNRFDNGKLKSIGWQQVVSTEEGLRRHFEYLQVHPPR